jgi:hypothetical protein
MFRRQARAIVRQQNHPPLASPRAPVAGIIGQRKMDSMQQPTKELPSAAELYEMIAEAAYYRAQKRGFTPGLEADDWVQAEAEVMERVRKVRSNGSGA